MSRSVAWLLQVLALVIVGVALMVGLAYDALKLEIRLLAIGGVLFLAGRWLEKRSPR